MQKFIPSRPGRHSDDFAPRVIRCPETHHVDAVRSAVRRRRETRRFELVAWSLLVAGIVLWASAMLANTWGLLG